MALRDLPYLPLYIQDFLTDEKLNECSPATVGVYIKIMCTLHKQDDYGSVLLKQKHKRSENIIRNFAYQFAQQITFSVDEMETALNELLEEKVLKLEGERLFQKRMVEDNDVSLKRANAGSSGGRKTQSRVAKAKTKANTEDENEDENEDRNISFNLFWEAYPKKKSKGDAKKAWKKINPGANLVKAILDKIKALSTSHDWKKEGGKYIPYPATWLRAHGWDDEVNEYRLQTEAESMAEKHAGALAFASKTHN